LYGTLLILVVVVISGLIAYLGDQIGMKVGKKRISIFGLRPKYTSIIITILTGVLIASLTITVILATNNGVRQALFNIQQVLSRLETTQNELDILNQQMLVKNLKLREKDNLLDDKDEQLQNKEAEIQKKEVGIQNIEVELANLKKQKEQLDEEKLLLEEQKGELQSKLDNIQLEYETAQSNIEELKATKVQLEGQLSKLQQEQQDLEERIDLLNQEVNRANKELSDTTLRYYLQDLVYQKGDVIYIDVVEKGKTQDETVDNIIEFVTKANQEVLNRPVMVDSETGSAISLKTEEVFGLATTILQSDTEKYIISLVTEVNVSQNMIVPVSFQLSPDCIVYQKGNLITEKVVDASKSVAELEDELIDILTTINTQSVKKGIITVEQGTVGTIRFSRFYEVLNEVQSFKGRVNVRVYATGDIWVEDGWNDQFSNKIRFDIEQVGGSNDG